MVEKFLAIWKDEEGQSMVEYGIIIALIAVVAIGAISTLGNKVKGTYEKINGELDSNLGGGGGTGTGGTGTGGTGTGGTGTGGTGTGGTGTGGT